MATERYAYEPFLLKSEIEALSHVIERPVLHHDVMIAALARRDESERMMALVDVEEARFERIEIIITESEAEHILIERPQVRALLDCDDNMPKAKRPGAKS